MRLRRQDSQPSKEGRGLAKVTRRRYLEIEEAVSHLRVKESKVALHTLAMYVDGAIEQWERVRKDEQLANDESALSRVSQRRGDKTNGEDHRQRHWAAKHQELLDLHFCIICVVKVGELMRAIIKKEKAERLNGFWKTWEGVFKRVHDMRGRLENPHSYLQEGWDKAYFQLFFDTSFGVREKELALDEVSAPRMAAFFEELISLLVSLP